MYLKCELPDGYFRIFDSISELVIPKERIMVNFPPPPKEMKEDQSHGICVWDAIDCLSEGGKYAISHLVGMAGVKGMSDPEIDFVCNPRRMAKHEEFENCASDAPSMEQRYPHHQMCLFKDSTGKTVVFVTQYTVYVCNDNGKTMEKF